jgi:uncharacterized protein
MNPILINNLEVAKKQEKIAGELNVSDCNRLVDLLVPGDENAKIISYQLTGTLAKFHLPSLQLKIDATLPVVCQRCLNPMQLSLSVNYDYVLSKAEPEPFDGDDDIDWLEMSREMNLNELIEDELLMAIPLAPTHTQGCKPAKLESGEKHNPFAALKDLIK